MDIYVKTFIYIIYGIDLLLVALMLWATCENIRRLMKYGDHNYDKPFRALFLVLCMSYLHANYEALQRHMFLFNSPGYKMAYETAQSLLNDRWNMLIAGVVITALTFKWVPVWFKKMLE